MLFAILLALVPFALAAPTPDMSTSSSCPVSSIEVPIIPGIERAAGEQTIFSTVGRGVQNYTCTAGKWLSAGALADLYDMSCMSTVLSPLFNINQTSTAIAFGALQAIPFPATDPSLVKFDHFFVRTAAGGIAPAFRDSRVGIEVVGSLISRADSPAGNVTTIPWLHLTAASGMLSKGVFRTHTIGGQAPPSCAAEGRSLSVPYTAMYYFTA